MKSLRRLTVLSVCGLVISGTSLLAQSQSDDIELTRAVIQAGRQAIIAANMGLTDEEGQRFWPIYREYRNDLAKNGDRTVLEDAENDLYLRYGWTIPVGSLRYWALGIPDPALPASTEFDEQGRLSSLAQAGWKVSITRYGEGGGQPMPTRLAASDEVTKVRLVIHDWLFFDQSR